MVADFFLTRKQLLLQFIKERKQVTTSQVIQWGLDRYYISAERMARTLAKEGYIRRLPKGTATFKYTKSKREYIWEYITQELS